MVLTLGMYPIPSCDRCLLQGVTVHDAWIMHDEVGDYGDHCPVALVLSI